MSKKKLSTMCQICESEFKLEFSEDLVQLKDNILCPFCGEEIEEVYENEKDDYTDYNDEMPDYWTEEE